MEGVECTRVGCLYVIKGKLKTLKGRVKVWNKEVFGDAKKKKKALVGEMANLDKKSEIMSLTEEECAKLKELLGELCKVSRINESIFHQKSHVKWLKDGDWNSRFFHSCVTWRRRTNNLVGLTLQGR